MFPLQDVALKGCGCTGTRNMLYPVEYRILTGLMYCSCFSFIFNNLGNPRHIGNRSLVPQIVIQSRACTKKFYLSCTQASPCAWQHSICVAPSRRWGLCTQPGLALGTASSSADFDRNRSCKLELWGEGCRLDRATVHAGRLCLYCGTLHWDYWHFYHVACCTG